MHNVSTCIVIIYKYLTLLCTLQSQMMRSDGLTCISAVPLLSTIHCDTRDIDTDEEDGVVNNVDEAFTFDPTAGLDDVELLLLVLAVSDTCTDTHTTHTQIK